MGQETIHDLPIQISLSKTISGMAQKAAVNKNFSGVAI